MVKNKRDTIYAWTERSHSKRLSLGYNMLATILEYSQLSRPMSVSITLAADSDASAISTFHILFTILGELGVHRPP